MSHWDRELRHVVDLDGQLLGIDAELVDAASLFRRVRFAGNRKVWLVQGGSRVLLEGPARVRLSPDEVTFFVTGAAEPMRVLHECRLAA